MRWIDRRFERIAHGAVRHVGYRLWAVISGTVIGRPVAAESIGPTLDSAATLTVTIAGTNITVTVDSSGHFELSGVPAGNIELLFRQGSSTWTVTITGVAAEEQIQIQINLSSGTPTIVSQSRTTAKVRLCHKTDANRYQLLGRRTVDSYRQIDQWRRCQRSAGSIDQSWQHHVDVRRDEPCPRPLGERRSHR